MSIETHPEVGPEVISRRLFVAGMFLLVFLASATYRATHQDIASGFDELAHVSYVASIQQHGSLIDFDSLRLLDPQTFRFTNQPNYLNHPNPYYVMLAAIGPPLVGHPGNLLFYRLLNVLIDTAGLAIFLGIGFFLFRDSLPFYAYVMPLVVIPLLPLLAGVVSNDNLALCGGAVALFGLTRLVQDEKSRWLYCLVAGVVIAAWAKLTAFLLAGSVAGAGAAYLIAKNRFRRAWYLPFGIGLVLAALPYLQLMTHYGSPAPDTAAQHLMLTSLAAAAGWDRAPRLAFPAYLLVFGGQFLTTWMPSLLPRTSLNDAILIVPVATVLVAGIGVAASARRLLQDKLVCRGRACS